MDLTCEERLSDSPFVERIWRSQDGDPGAFISIANSHCSMVVSRVQDKTYVTVRGPETYATPAYQPEDAEFFGIEGIAEIGRAPGEFFALEGKSAVRRHWVVFMATRHGIVLNRFSRLIIKLTDGVLRRFFVVVFFIVAMSEAWPRAQSEREQHDGEQRT